MAEYYLAEFIHGPWHKERRVLDGDHPKLNLYVPMLPAYAAAEAKEGDTFLNGLTAVYELRGPKEPNSPTFLYEYKGYHG